MERDDGIIGVINPTFEEYPNRYSREKKVLFTPADENFRYDEKDIIDYFGKNYVDMIILVNPDNPTGNYIRYDGVIKIFEWAAKNNKRVVLDESFIDFADVEKVTFLCNDVLEKYPNVIIVKSISKSYGVPGIRLGVAASGDKALIEDLKRNVAIWNINSFGEFYMQIAEKYKKDYDKGIEKLHKERKRFISLLSKIKGLEILPTQANYIMARLTGGITAHELTKNLLVKYDILIKDLTSKINKTGHMGQYIRIAIRDEKDNDRLIAALNEQSL